MPETTKPRFTLEIDAPVNGRFTKSTIFVFDGEEKPVYSDQVNLIDKKERVKAANRMAEALKTEADQLLELLETRWNDIIAERLRIRAAEQAKEAAPPPLQAHEEDPEAEELRQLQQMPDAVRHEAEEVLRDPSLMERVVADLELMGVAGEVELKATLYLVFTSRKLSRPLSARVRGPSSSGKSYVIEKVAELIPPESKILASQMTPQALFYLEKGSLRHKLIVAGERSRNQNDEAADGTRALREMVSAGRLSKLVPLKGENGMETVLIEQGGPISFVESTTLGEIFAEDDNRMLALFTDEQAEQTRRIIKSLATAATRQSADLHKLESIRQLYWAVQRLLRRLEIVIPFASRLGATLPDQRVETRRAFPYLLSMISASALLHQYQRQRDAEGQVIAVREDYVNAALLLAGPMQRLLGRGISDQASRFCERLKKWFPAGQPFYTREALAKEQGSRSAVYGWLVELRNAGAVKQVNESSGGRGAIWQVSGPEVGSATATAEFVLPTADLVFGPNVAA